jgi:hypothetical protein
MVLFNKVDKPYAGVGAFKFKPPTRSNIGFAANSQVAVNTCIPTYGTHHNTDVRHQPQEADPLDGTAT